MRTRCSGAAAGVARARSTVQRMRTSHRLEASAVITQWGMTAELW